MSLHEAKALDQRVMELRSEFLQWLESRVRDDVDYGEVIEAFDNASAGMVEAVRARLGAEFKLVMDTQMAALRDDLTRIVQNALDAARRA